MENLILYHSTNKKAPLATFAEALLKGLAPDKGLFMPEYIPVLSKDEISSFKNMPYYEIAFTIIKQYLKGQIPDEALLGMVKDAYDFEIPLELVCDRKYIMRLDQGPTASFKDFAARMMGQLMQYFLGKENRKLLILTATSGDTGSAIANAFYELDNINVLVLYPEEEVTDMQRKQMTTLGKNIKIISLDGKFDDCQAMVKEAFMDKEIEDLNLSSANSINIGRLIPQIVYFFYSYSRLCNNENESVVFSVPSGNFGDMMGGVLAMHMGLPVKKFIIATNKNDEFPKYLNTGIYSPIDSSINCISSAMNVGHPSNIARLVEIYNGEMDEKGRIIKDADLLKMRKQIWSTSVTDTETKATIYDAWKDHKLLLEPHGAVAWEGLKKYIEAHPEDNTKDQLFISLETAHPAKFPEEIKKILNIDPELPESLKGIESRPESFIKMENDYEAFKLFLKANY